MRGKRPAQASSSGAYFPKTEPGQARFPTAEPVVKQEEVFVNINKAPPVKVKEDPWEDVRSTSLPPPAASSAPPPPLPVIDDSRKRERERESESESPVVEVTASAGPTDPRVTQRALKAAKAQKTSKAGGAEEKDAGSGNQHDCLLVVSGSGYQCKLAYMEESSNTEVNENTANAREKITKLAGASGSGAAINLETFGLEVLALARPSGKESDPFFVMQLACRGLGPAVSLCGPDILAFCKTNYSQKQVMKVRLDGEHNLYLVSLLNLGKQGSPGMYGFLVKEDERSGNGRPSLVKDIVLQTMIGGKINVGFNLEILLAGESLNDFDTKEKMLMHMGKNPLHKYFSDMERKEYSNIRYYAKKKDTDWLFSSELVPEYMKKNLLEIPDSLSSDDDLDLSATSYPLTIMFGVGDHNESQRFVDKMGKFVQDVQQQFYQEVKSTLADYVNNFLKRPEASYPSLVESIDWSFDTILKEKRDKFKLELNVNSQMRAGEGLGGMRRAQESTPMYNSRDRTTEPPSQSAPEPQQQPQTNHIPTPNPAQPAYNTFVETRTFVARQVPLPESPLQKLINQSWLAKKTEFYDFVSDLNDIGEDAGMRTLDEICRWMKHENPYTNSNGHEQSVHGVHGVQSVQNNGAQLVPVDQQNYDQFMIQQGYDDYPCIEPQLTNDDYIAEIKRVFRPDIGIGNQRYNCISINLAPGDVRYCLQLNLNQSLGQNCLTNKSRLEELLQHVPTKSFHSGSIGNEQCCYHSYCIAKIGQIALGIGLGPNKKVANQAAAKVVLEKVFQVDSFEVEC